MSRAAGTAMAFYLSQLVGTIHGFPIVIGTPAAKRETVRDGPGVAGSGCAPRHSELPAATSCAQQQDWERSVLPFPSRQAGPSLLGCCCCLCPVPLGRIPADEMFDLY